MIKTFVSYHHANDQAYKDALVTWAENEGLIRNFSVETGDIDESMPTQTIRRIIRDQYLRDTELTILLCGKETRYRKHVDWELKSSMIDGSINKQSGILVIDLPSSRSTSWYTNFVGEKERIYPGYGNWSTIETKSDFETLYPDMPRRILENMLAPYVQISVVPWQQIYGHADRLAFLLINSAAAGRTNIYDLSRPMRMKNYNPKHDFYDLRN